MHFGRVADDRGLDLQLPEDRPRTEGYLKLAHEGRGLIYCGAPIWSSPEWVPEIYPERAKPSEYLQYYARHYSMVELNSSFYHLPTRDQVRLWTLQTGPEFRFCPKVPKDISHHLTQGFDRELLRSFQGIVETFGEKHGISFLQLPEWFEAKSFPALERFVQAWGQSFPLAVEFRHPSWFRDHMLLDPVINFLYRQKLSAVITDSPGERDVLHMSLTYPSILLRFVGCFPSRKDELRLKAWLDRLMGWMEAGLDAAYVAVHQARNASIPRTVDYAIRYLYEKEFPGLVRPRIDEDLMSH